MQATHTGVVLAWIEASSDLTKCVWSCTEPDQVKIAVGRYVEANISREARMTVNFDVVDWEFVFATNQGAF